MSVTTHKIDRTKRPNKGGRPRKTLDENLVYRLGQTCLSIETICIILQCGKDLLYDKYSEVLQKGRADRQQSLVEAMWDKALNKGSENMMIWLSKQHLGYKDRQPDEAPSTVINVMVNETP